MSHTGADWGVQASKATIYTLTDMAELAARLGSINTFDRRGDVVWMDDFESTTLKWESWGNGTGYAMARSTSYANRGNASMAITTGSDGERLGGMGHDSYFPIIGKFGIELWFNLTSNVYRMEILLAVYDGAWYKEALIYYFPDTDELQYRGDDALYHTFATDLKSAEALSVFLPIKLVVDFDTCKYVRLVTWSKTYDLSAYSFRKVASFAEPGMIILIRNKADSAINLTTYIDDVILTQNEP